MQLRAQPVPRILLQQQATTGAATATNVGTGTTDAAAQPAGTYVSHAKNSKHKLYKTTYNVKFQDKRRNVRLHI